MTYQSASNLLQVLKTNIQSASNLLQVLQTKHLPGTRFLSPLLKDIMPISPYDKDLNMCGIVGAITKRPVSKLLLDGLKKLEYRGYDSAGIAVINTQNELKCLRVNGKVRELESVLNTEPLNAFMGIAHTRWATHGVPSEENAHPLVSHNQFALVHNGIIENHARVA